MIAIKEHPIIFNTENVKAILDGIKTQTRRVMKPQPIQDGNIFGWHLKRGNKTLACWAVSEATIRHDAIKFCPYGQVGDRLWVRETWHSIEHPTENNKEFVTYKATAHPHILKTVKWKPSIHMPRWASRITLEITEVRVERVQEIAYLDAKAEGILRFDREHPDTDGGMGYNRGAIGLPMRYESTAAFMDLWDSLNAKRGYGWEVNPWVWCLSFKVPSDVNITATEEESESESKLVEG